MFRAERPHHLLAEIYEAGVDPDLWPPLLGNLAEYLGATACALTAHDFGPGVGTICQASGYDPGYVRSYAERYAACNVWLRDESRYRPAPSSPVASWSRKRRWSGASSTTTG